MIDSALEILKTVITNYLSALPELNINSTDFVELTSLVNQEGKIELSENTIGLTLVNVEEERVTKSQKPVQISSDGMVSEVNPEIKLNLFMLVTSNFKKYDTGLQYLSAVIRCFQSRNVFTPDSTPEMDPALKKLIVELFTLNLEQQNHLWGSLGAKYMPSVIYRLRLVTVQEAVKKSEQAPIRSYDINTG